MKKNRINTTSVREIKHSFKRFISLVIMSMLGVLVFVGIKMSAPDMLMSLDKYYDNKNLYDIKMISTLGFVDDDINNIKALDGIKEVYPSYSKDVLVKTNKQEVVSKVISITDDVNKIDVIKGRMPKNDGEIVVEENFLKKENMKINDKVRLLDDNTFKKTYLTIVGVVKSPLYINSDASTIKRGNTNIGTGKIDYYTYVLKDNFNIDYYTEVYLTLNNAKDKLTDSKDYNKLVNSALKKINKVKPDLQKRRYDDIYNKINNEIITNEQEKNAQFLSAKKELDKSKNTLDNAKIKLNDANYYLSSSLNELNLYSEKLNASKKELDDFKLKLDDASNEIKTAQSAINDGLKPYNFTYDDVKNANDQLRKAYRSIMVGLVPKDIENYDEVINIINDMTDDEVNEWMNNYMEDSKNIDKMIKVLPPQSSSYNEIVVFLFMYKQNKEVMKILIDKIDEIENSKAQYDLNFALYNNLLQEYNNAKILYNNRYNEYQNKVSSYNNSLENYNNNLNLYNEKVKEYYDSKKAFDLQIIEAKKKLDEIPNPAWYVYDRLDDSNYASYIDDGNSVSNLSKVFPTIFFIVAILISLISMSRMVEDDRILIGTLKSLGFGNKHIRKKYLLYSGIATFLGGIIGACLGFFIMPVFIWNIYKILFDVPSFSYDFNPLNTILGILISVICICGTTLITIKNVVKEKPSELMRPKAPENGKRVILEKIPFIWNKLKFSNKITVRNLFRYKKRVLMTVGGILGCTALMLAGFGIRDSIVGIPNKQYGEIFNFDQMVYLTDDVSFNDENEIFNNEHIVKKLNTKMDASMKLNGYDINLFVPEDVNDMNGIINLKDLKTKKKLNLENNKVIITDKLAELTNKKVNDKIKLISSDNKTYEFTISAISENYAGNYVFMNKQTYEKNINSYATNIVYICLDDIKYEEKTSKELLKNPKVMSVISSDITINGINDMLKSLNSVVLILIILSGALSFVVLYNLSYINISERKREIATLKVLGFTDKEVDKYITKETIILTIIGIILGLIFGIFLTNVIIHTIEIKSVRFLHNIKIYSFVMTSFLILSFAIIVNKIIHYALKKIDMIESLKSVE